MNDEQNTWACDPPIQRHMAAAEMWMEMTGRKQAAAGADARGVMAKIAEAQDAGPSPGRWAKGGLAAGAALGATIGGLATHHNNVAKAGLARRIGGAAVRAESVLPAILGGGVVGGGAGGAIGGGVGLKRAVNHAHRRFAYEEPGPSLEKGASAFAKVANFDSSLSIASPAIRRAIGAAAVGLPAAATGAVMAHHFRPRAGGTSAAHVDASSDLQRHDAHVKASGREGVHDRLKRRYLAIREELVADAARHPRAATLAAAGILGVMGGSAGARIGHDLL